MNKLLEFDPDKRWSLQDVLKSRWFHAQAPLTPNELKHESLLSRKRTAESIRLHLKKYISRKFVSGYGAHITALQQHLIGKKILELDFGHKYGCTILLIKYNDGTFERVPGAHTEICAGSWIYFGLPPMKQGHDEALTAICHTLYKRKFEPQFRDLRESVGNLVPFVPEFDSFEFPEREEYSVLHRDYAYVLGPTAQKKHQIALDMRRIHNVNVCGIVHMPRRGRSELEITGEEEFEVCFPGADTEVYPGDLGLVVRAPLRNGLSQPTVRDVDLNRLMSPDRPLSTKSFRTRPTSTLMGG